MDGTRDSLSFFLFPPRETVEQVTSAFIPCATIVVIWIQMFVIHGPLPKSEVNIIIWLENFFKNFSDFVFADFNCRVIPKKAESLQLLMIGFTQFEYGI